jgi:hypothetical protein
MYSILNERKELVNFKKATSLKKLAEIRIAYQLKQEGIDTNVAGVVEFVHSWAEFLGRTNEIEINEVIDEISSCMVYSNVHFLKNKVQISNDDRDQVFQYTYDLLYKCFNK